MGYSRTVRAATPRSGQNLDGCSVTPPLEPPAIVFSKCPHSRFGDVVPIDLCMGMTSDNSGTHAASVGRRRGDIQGLRAVAVLLVVIYHADLGFSGGFVGVDVFFVISGYVITTALTTELGRTDRVNLGHFHLGRIRRLLPALGAMLTVVMLASSLLSPIGGQQITARTGAAAALFNANTYLIRFGNAGGYFDVDANVNALLHTWSLSVE